MKWTNPFSEIRGAWRKNRRDALRLGVQAGLAAAAYYLLMRWLGLPEVFVGTIGAVLILQASADGTMGAALQRLTATGVGSAIALLCLLVLPDAWGTAVALFVSMAVMNAVTVLKPNWQYGLVGAIAVALATPGDALAVSLDRLVAIAIGAAVGLAVSLAVFPDNAARRFERHFRRALAALADRLEAAAAATSEGEDPLNAAHEARYQEAYRNASEASAVMRLRRVQNVADRLHHLQRLHNSIILLDRTLETVDAAPLDSTDEEFRAEVGKLAETIRHLADAAPADLPDLADPVRAAEADRGGALRFGLRELQLEIRHLSETAPATEDEGEGRGGGG